MLRAALDHVGFLLRDRETPAGRATNLTLYVLNTVFLGLYIASTYDLSAVTLATLRWAELTLAVVFLGEYFVRLYVAPVTREELTDPYTVVDLLAILPVFVVPAPDVSFLRGLYTIRIFRFLRLLVNERQLLGKPLRAGTIRRLELSMTIFLIFFIATGFLYAVETTANPAINNFGDAFYYTVIAVSTVGFGDIVPVTQAGRWVTVIAVLVGFVLIPWQASRLREPLVDGESTCAQCGEPVEETDRYCSRCGSRLDVEGGTHRTPADEDGELEY